MKFLQNTVCVSLTLLAIIEQFEPYFIPEDSEIIRFLRVLVESENWVTLLLKFASIELKSVFWDKISFNES